MKRVGPVGGVIGTSWTRPELKTVATRVAGRYSVATDVKAFIAFESFSLCSLSRVRTLACSPNRASVCNIVVLVLSSCLLVRNSRILWI